MPDLYNQLFRDSALLPFVSIHFLIYGIIYDSYWLRDKIYLYP